MHSDDQKETFRRRFEALYYSLERLKTYRGGGRLRHRIEPFSVSYFLDELHVQIHPEKSQEAQSGFSKNKFSQWRAAKCFPTATHQAALKRLLEKHLWESREPGDLETLVATMSVPEFEEDEWQTILCRCRPQLSVRDPGTRQAKLQKVVTTGLRPISMASFPSGWGPGKVAGYASLGRLVDDVILSMNGKFNVTQADILRSYLYRIPEESLLRLLQEGGCALWEAKVASNG